MDTTWQRSILAALVYSLLLSYIVAMPVARIFNSPHDQKTAWAHVTYYHNISSDLKKNGQNDYKIQVHKKEIWDTKCRAWTNAMLTPT